MMKKKLVYNLLIVSLTYLNLKKKLLSIGMSPMNILVSPGQQDALILSCELNLIP